VSNDEQPLRLTPPVGQGDVPADRHGGAAAESAGDMTFPINGPISPPVDDRTTIQLFEKAVAEHGRRLVAIARAIVGNRVSPEDVVQQAFMNLYQHRARYDWREPGGLLRRTVVNESLRILRQPRIAQMAEDGFEPPERQPSQPSGAMLQRELVAHVRTAIDKLPEHFRAALVLCEYENMPYLQIAETLNASIPQVKTWIHRGRRQLAVMLKEFAEPR